MAPMPPGMGPGDPASYASGGSWNPLSSAAVKGTYSVPLSVPHARLPGAPAPRGAVGFRVARGPSRERTGDDLWGQ